MISHIVRWQCRGCAPLGLNAHTAESLKQWIEAPGADPLVNWLFLPTEEECPHYIGAQLNIIAPPDAFVRGNVYVFQEGIK